MENHYSVESLQNIHKNIRLNSEIAMATEVTNWLLSSDPSIVFQTKRDILHFAKSEWLPDQKRILTEGWGKQLLDLQDKDGRWGGGLYGPKFISTHYTLQLLRRLEMLPNDQTRKGCEQLQKMGYIGGIQGKENNQKETCITGMVLAILSHFDNGEMHFSAILDFMDKNKLEDGAWNCRYPRTKSVSHSSVHTTLLVLEGLRELKDHFPSYANRVDKLIKSANEFLLSHELYKSHRTGLVANPEFTEISFPPRWKYNILSALDYFRSINYEYDKRMEDAIEIVQDRNKNGYWYQGKQMSGKRYFSLNTPRKPSELNTLRALRVLKFYNP